MLAMKARKGPITQETAERLLLATGHIFDEVVANFLPLAWLVRLQKSSLSRGPSDSSGGNMVWTTTA